MRYARMLRPRRRPNNLKLGHTLALHLRHSRTSSLVAALITFPFFLALILSFLRPPTPRPHFRLPFSFQQFTKDPPTATQALGARLNTTIPDFLHSQASRRAQPIAPDRSVSLIAACMNRRESLGIALPSWEALQQINEIILVDWASATPTYGLPRLSGMIATGRVSLIRVENVDSWVLSRAYNLAARFATGKYILKVDCDTHLDAAFMQKQPLPPAGRYYTATWGSERDSNEQKLRGVWFGHATDFRNIGGYDERIVRYGYEDTELYKRLDRLAEAVSLDLDSVRHNIAGDVVWRRESTPSRRISTRMNEALLSRATSWGEVLAAGNGSKYEYTYDNVTHVMYASMTSSAPRAQEGIDVDAVERLKTEVLQKALHDDFSMPWDLLPSLRLVDLEFLAGYLDSDEGGHVIVATLDGHDTVSNIFNLVSAVQLGITSGRPVVTTWTPPAGKTVEIAGNGTLLPQLIDVDGTNERLRQAVQSVSARRHGFSRPTRVIPAGRWACQEGLAACAKAYDAAYAGFVDVVGPGARVYDESEPVPVSVKRHALVRLGNMTKLGGVETRALAYACVSVGEVVERKVRMFRAVGLVAGSTVNYTRLVGWVRAKGLDGGSGVWGVVGAGQYVVRRLFGDVERFCDKVCGVKEMVLEMANVIAVVRARVVLPDVGDASRERWEEHADDVGRLMIADLRLAYRQSTRSN